MGYSIEIISKAEREFLKLPETIQKQIRRQILSSKITQGLPVQAS